MLDDAADPVEAALASKNTRRGKENNAEFDWFMFESCQSRNEVKASWAEQLERLRIAIPLYCKPG